MSVVGPQQLESDDDFDALLRAVLASGAEDESDWIEWKSELDLGLRAAKAAIGRCILGFANRDPDNLNDECGGCGVLVVGVEPGSLKGVTAIDPADLTPPIEAIVGGARGPTWTYRYVNFKDAKVLVVKVAPPRVGDPIFAARKSSDKVTSGHVYVRKRGRTEQADAADMDMLQARLTRGGVGRGITMRLAGGPARTGDIDSLREAAKAWVDEVVALKTEQGRRAVPERPKNSWGDMSSPDPRTFEEYLDELDEWRDEALEWAIETVLAEASAESSPVVVEVVDTESKFHPGVELVVSFDGARVVPADELVDHDDAPHLPLDFGRRSTFLVPFNYSAQRPLADFRPVGASHFELSENRLIFTVGDLRPGYSRCSDGMFIFSPSKTSSLSVRWTATFSGHDRQISGSTDIAIDQTPINLDVRGLLYRAAGDAVSVRRG